ncbi:MAG TPA: sugar phosphate nucleotidyltransferase [Geobacterales bacterium]|nr:sugar phosphate nucleotidyltransferase [Geobacterales bacterium]
MVSRAIITAAGLGTRLLPTSKELPKEMLAIFAKNHNGNIILKPLLQIIYEQLFDFGIRDFCFVVGRGKRAIEDHFTPDWDFVKKLKEKGKNTLAYELELFYDRIQKSNIIWINQPEPRGFGHAVLMAKPFIKDEPFIVCAGDTVIFHENEPLLKRLERMYEEMAANAALLLQYVEDPRQYGVAIVERTNKNYLKVKSVIEKPAQIISNLAIMPYYIFDKNIMDKLEKIEPGIGNEIQLTDAIQALIDDDLKVFALELDKGDLRLDIGTPETYWEALKLSYERNNKTL